MYPKSERHGFREVLRRRITKANLLSDVDLSSFRVNAILTLIGNAYCQRQLHLKLLLEETDIYIARIATRRRRPRREAPRKTEMWRSIAETTPFEIREPAQAAALGCGDRQCEASGKRFEIENGEFDFGVLKCGG
ncbi:hypothetical protein SASPL_116011 [Salvia splendens]|uniref:Uncharacterized protein n=1 Tax=Salvia splendens TaxID=180675 RepID=A0A8X8Y8P2_SALSN|nr:hypothetical protein SASPL_116011 [Salvia splendens]